jgi:single-stranded-DNA-specific exonuclease
MSFRWIYAQSDDEIAVSLLQNQLGVSDTIARLLSIRGIHTFEQARTFFRPSISALHDPYLMKDMGKAANRLAQAVRAGEKVLIYGDYDVDGTTATTIMYKFLKQFGVNADYFIPHRFKDGYGISEEGITRAIEQHATLVVSVDCGITAVDEARFAKERGIDLIICDHHTTGDIIPDALAVLDPKRPDCNYPFDGLSGAGVAFKLVQATINELGLPAEHANQYLDLVAISIASDIVPIVDENRILMREGLRLVNSEPRKGIKALLDLLRITSGKISTSQIVFSIGPRINAAGRMGDASTAVELLIADDEATAAEKAKELEGINIRRRTTDTETMEHALLQIEERINLDKHNAVVLHNPDWHLGVIGIVASRIVDLYCRPTIMLSTVDGQVKGSARSIRGFNIYNALKQCEDLLIQFGGHEFAAGLTLEESNLEPFIKRFQALASQTLCDEDFKPELFIDSEIDLSHVDLKFWKILSQFEPFGPDNLRPIFVSKNLRVVGTPTVVGKGHLKMKVAQNGSAVFDAIGFNMHEHLPKVRESKDGQLNMAYVLEENTWQNRTSIQIRIKDIQLED